MCHLSQVSGMRRSQLCGRLGCTLWTENSKHSAFECSVLHPTESPCGLEEEGCAGSHWEGSSFSARKQGLLLSALTDGPPTRAVKKVCVGGCLF